MQTANLWNRDYLAVLGRIDLTMYGRVAIQRKMGSRFVVILEIQAKDATKMAFVDHNDVIQTLAAN